MYWWSANLSLKKGCLYPMSISRRCLIQCFKRHSGIICVSVEFLRDLLISLYSGTVSAVKCGVDVSSSFL